MGSVEEITLVRQGGSDFPPGWGHRMTDVAYWQPSVVGLGAQHGLRLNGRLEAGKEGSHAVFLTDDLVIKIYAAPWPIWFAREVECLRVLTRVPAARAPRLLAQGPATNGDTNHPYILMERLPGEPLSGVWDTLSLEDRCSMAAQIAAMLRALHAAPLDSLCAFETAPADWVRIMRARAALCGEYLRQGDYLPSHLLPQLPGFLEANLDAITEDFRPCLLSGDAHGDHILVEERGGAWRVTGHIDFGDAEVGPVEYEWVALCLDAFCGETPVIRAFFDVYGTPLPFGQAARQRLKLYTLLHRFANPNGCARAAGRPNDAPTLDAFLDSLWPV